MADTQFVPLLKSWCLSTKKYLALFGTTYCTNQTKHSNQAFFSLYTKRCGMASQPTNMKYLTSVTLAVSFPLTRCITMHLLWLQYSQSRHLPFKYNEESVKKCVINIYYAVVTSLLACCGLQQKRDNKLATTTDCHSAGWWAAKLTVFPWNCQWWRVEVKVSSI